MLKSSNREMRDGISNSKSERKICLVEVFKSPPQEVLDSPPVWDNRLRNNEAIIAINLIKDNKIILCTAVQTLW